MLLLAGSSASAQTTTRCSTDYFGNVTCRTDPQPGVNWNLLDPNAYSNTYERTQRAFEDAQRQRLLIEQQRALEAERQRLEAERYYRRGQEQQAAEQSAQIQELHKRISEMVAAGDCEAAASEALKAGNLELGLGIKRHCAP